MSLLSIIKEEYAEVQKDLRFIDVPEWGEKGQPLRIYYKPSINLTGQGLIQKEMEKSSVDAIVMSLVFRALDENGEKLFKNADKAELKRSANPDVITRIVLAMNDADNIEEDELKKSLN